MNFSSKLIDEAVSEISKLPGIGEKTALRLVLFLLKQNPESSQNLAQSLLNLRMNIKYCKTCHMVVDSDTCSCKSIRKDHSIICVVEDIPEVIAIENTGQYQGLYHVLGGVISPIEGVGPEDLNIRSLISRISTADPEVKEIILALSPTMEGDTTAFYITKKLNPFNLKISAIARGIPIGGDLEFTDEITLGQSILRRTTLEQNPAGD